MGTGTPAQKALNARLAAVRRVANILAPFSREEREQIVSFAQSEANSAPTNGTVGTPVSILGGTSTVPQREVDDR